jgi:hypothetical protein
LQYTTALAASITLQGQLVWSRSYADPPPVSVKGVCNESGRWNSATDIVHTFDGGYAITGLYGGSISEGPTPCGSSLYVIKIDSLGNTDSLVTIPFGSSGVRALPESRSLSINPQPVISTATILLPSSITNADFSLYSVSGERVQHLALHSASEVRFERGNLPSGVYFFRITSSDLAPLSGTLVVD